MGWWLGWGKVSTGCRRTPRCTRRKALSQVWNIGKASWMSFLKRKRVFPRTSPSTGREHGAGLGQIPRLVLKESTPNTFANILDLDFTIFFPTALNICMHEISMRQPLGTFFSLSTVYLQTRRNGKHQMQAARTQKSAEHGKGVRQDTTVPPHLLFDHTKWKGHRNQQHRNHKGIKLKLIGKSAKGLWRGQWLFGRCPAGRN